MSFDILAGLRAAAEFAFKPARFPNLGQRAGGLLLDTVEFGDILPDQILGHKAVAIDTLVATGDDALKVGGEDRVP